MPKFHSAAQGIWKCSANHIQGNEWFTKSKDGKGSIVSTGPGSSPTPPDYFLMSYGACIGNGVKGLLEKKKIPFSKLHVDIEGIWTEKPQKRLGEIKFNIQTDANFDEKEVLDHLKNLEMIICPLSATTRIAPLISNSINKI